MIRLSGPRKVKRGRLVCLKASGIGSGFSAKASGPQGGIDVKVSINAKDQTAVICFVFPEDGGPVGVDVANSSGGRESLIVKEE